MNGYLSVYTASAGSGKTFTLAVNYVAHLLSGEPMAHRHILAVTFTNKATAEMKTRILAELWSLAHGEPDHDFLNKLKELLPGVSDEEIKSRAVRALAELIHNYEDFRIETIDSFFQSVLASLARELGLTASYNLEIDDRKVIAQAVDHLMASLDNRPDLLRRIMAYIYARIEDDKRWDVSAELTQLASVLTKEVFLSAEDKILQILGNEEVMKHYVETLQSMKAAAINRIKEAAQQLDDSIRREGGYAILSRGGNLETQVGKLAKGELIDNLNMLTKRAESPDEWFKKADRDKPGNAHLASKWTDLATVLMGTLRREKPTYLSCQLTLQYLNPLQLVGDVGQEVRDINAELGRFMLAMTPILFRRLVTSADASFVFEKAGVKFHHIMIDEFQDTSPLQWANFRQLLIENLSQGNGCMLVGDIKQGIYRFRGGDWKILGRIVSDLQTQGLQPIRLSDNYRSRADIVRFNNALFTRAGELMKDTFNADDLADIYSDVAQEPHKPDGGHVEVHFVEKSSDKGTAGNAEEGDTTGDSADTNIAEELANSIMAENEKGTPYSDMIILVRYKAEGVKLVDYFAQNYPDLPIISDEAFTLGHSEALTLLVNALRWLDCPSDTVAAAYTARAYQYHIHHRTLAWLDTAAHWRDYLPAELATQTERLVSMPLYSLCERLIALLSLHQMTGDAPYIYGFLDHVMDFADNARGGLHDFLRLWDDSLNYSAIPSPGVAGVRIMTIHKSKGLEAPTIFIPYCNWYIEREKRVDVMWCTPPVAPYNTLPLVAIPGKKDLAETIYAPIWESELSDRHTENLNLLYVAFTRPKQNLYVWAEVNSKVEFTAENASKLTVANLLYECLGGEDVSLGEPVREGVSAKPKDKPEAANPFKPQMHAIDAPLSAVEPCTAFRQSLEASRFISGNEIPEAQRAFIDTGNVMHYALSLMSTAADLDRAFEAIAEHGLMPDSKQRKTMHDLLKERLSTGQPADWFGGRWTVSNECTLLGRDASGRLKRTRPDRVMTHGEKTVVVDFKFAAPHPRHTAQVADYVKSLRDMGHADVEGFLWYVYTGRIVRVD